METLFDSIRAAIADGASNAERSRGTIDCRTLADILDGRSAPSETTTRADVEPPPTPVEPASPAAIALATLSTAGASNPFTGLTADQILDAAIARLRSAIGDNAPPEPAGPPFRVTLVAVPRYR